MKSNFLTCITILIVVLSTIFTNLAWAQSEVTLEKGDLKAVFIDNSAYGVHRSGYNGISELYHKDQDSTLFVPLYAGVNLEHIYDGDSLISLFEPRRQPMSIKKISDTKVLLHQPTASISNVESWTVFEMLEPHYIDMEFKFVVHDEEFFDQGYIGLFWASYINRPEEIGINFKGKKKNSRGKGDWLHSVSEKHGDKGTHIGDKDNYKSFVAPNFNVNLTVEISDYVFTEPYYYGRFRNMVFAYLFEEPKEGNIRFSKSPSGAGKGRPAWDFQYILPDFEVGKEYAIKLRVVYKEWDDQKDIEKEYKKWTKSLE